MVNIRDFIDSNSNNLSKGDKVIGEDVSNTNTGSFNIRDAIETNSSTDLIETIGTDKVIPVARNDDDSVKVTFDNIYENNDLAEVSKDFYYFRDQKQFKDNKEAIDYYINDRTWKQANVVSIGREYSYITGEDIKKDQLPDYKVEDLRTINMKFNFCNGESSPLDKVYFNNNNIVGDKDSYINKLMPNIYEEKTVMIYSIK